MSLTKFDNITRSAIWHTYNHTCFYCNKSLEWDNLHIDHIIPEGIDREVLEKAIIDYGLENFEINALYNLVPSHVMCNLRKSDNLFPKNTILYYFELTQKKVDKIEKEIEKIKNRKNKGLLLSKLQSALDNGVLKINELENIINLAKENNWAKTKIELSYGVEFIDEIYDSFYLNMDYSHIYNKKLYIGELDYLKLYNDMNKTIKVRTLKEWIEAIDNAFYPLSTLDIKMSSYFTFPQELLKGNYPATLEYGKN